MLDCDGTSTLEPIGNANRMNTPIQEGFTLLKKGTSKDYTKSHFTIGAEVCANCARTDNTSSSITNLIVLALRQLYQQLRDLVLNFHLPKNRCTIVCHSDVAVGGNQNFVKTYEGIDIDYVALCLNMS